MHAGYFIGLFSKQAFNKQAQWFKQTCAFVGLPRLLFPSCSVAREGHRSQWGSLNFQPLTLFVRLADLLLSARRTGSVANWQTAPHQI